MTAEMAQRHRKLDHEELTRAGADRTRHELQGKLVQSQQAEAQAKARIDDLSQENRRIASQIASVISDSESVHQRLSATERERDKLRAALDATHDRIDELEGRLHGNTPPRKSPERNDARRVLDRSTDSTLRYGINDQASRGRPVVKSASPDFEGPGNQYQRSNGDPMFSEMAEMLSSELQQVIDSLSSDFSSGSKFKGSIEFGEAGRDPSSLKRASANDKVPRSGPGVLRTAADR